MNKKICAVGARKPPKIGYDELAVKLHSNYSRGDINTIPSQRDLWTDGGPCNYVKDGTLLTLLNGSHYHILWKPSFGHLEAAYPLRACRKRRIESNFQLFRKISFYSYLLPALLLHIVYTENRITNHNQI